METYYAGLKHIKQDIAPKILDSSVNILKSLPAKIGTILREGEPAKYIIEGAETAGVDLIVMGARGLTQNNNVIIPLIYDTSELRREKMATKPPPA
jgi:nucleotide-binding universal stress UspA family protein